MQLQEAKSRMRQFVIPPLQEVLKHPAVIGKMLAGLMTHPPRLRTCQNAVSRARRENCPKHLKLNEVQSNGVEQTNSFTNNFRSGYRLPATLKDRISKQQPSWLT